MPSICDCDEQRNRDMIWQACHDFGSAESMFSECPIVTRFWENVSRFSACWASFQDKVGRTLSYTPNVSRFGQLQGTI